MISIKRISINFDNDSNKAIPFQISGEEGEVDIHIYADFKEDFKVCLINPNNKRSKFISMDTQSIRNQIGNEKINGETYVFDNATNYRKIRIKLSPKDSKEKIQEGKWKLLFINEENIKRTINIYIKCFSFYPNSRKIMKIDRQFPKYFDVEVGYSIRYGPGFEEELMRIAPNFEFIKVSDNIGIISGYVNYQDPNSIQTLRNVISISSIQQLRVRVQLSSLSIISQGISNGINANEEIGANFLKNNPNIILNGRGVLIGIIDTGIDYLHPDFIYEDNTSKIVSIWDQTKEGNPPEGFYIGSEFTREDINQAIIDNNNTLSIDDVGSGTMLAGICAGMGNVDSNYAGVAEQAELVVVKMATINGHYEDVLLKAAHGYILKKAEELQRPVVINVSCGSNNHVGESNRNIGETTFFEKGVSYVNGIGNEGNTGTHSSGRLLYNDDVKGIQLVVDEYEENINIEIWINRPDVVKAAIVSPTGELTRDVAVTNLNTTSGIFDVESTVYSITYIFPTTYSGQQHILISLTNVNKGTWVIRLTGQSITNGVYNAYLQNREFLKSSTRFMQPDSDRTVNFPATYRDNITVGAYDIINNNLWSDSSRGNTINGVLKPDIVAPGVNIIAPFPRGRYATITGTAPAAAYTSGCVALLLQYTMVDGNYPNLGFVQKLRTLLRVGATRITNTLYFNTSTIYPNNILGYGFLNIRNTFDELK